MDARLEAYLRGLGRLKAEVEADGGDYQVLDLLQMRLKENIDARMNGDTKDNQAQRMEILASLNRFTRNLYSISFDEYCQLNTSQQFSPKPNDQSAPMTPAESEELKEALLSAFPAPGELQQVVAFKLGKNLSVIAGGSNYSEVVFNLIRWAEAHEKIDSLLIGARQMNPGNSRLRVFEEQYRALRSQ
jgi:hypothetical protein